MTEFYANINGIKICYEIHGKGHPIILIHGFGSRKEGFKCQIPTLSKIFRVITFDNRGAGKSERVNQPYTMQTLADDIRSLLDFLEIKKTHILGTSMGGIIAQQFILQYPEYANKLVLVNTVSGAPNNEALEILKKNRLEQLELIKNNPEKAFWDNAHIWFYHKYRKELKANPKKKYFGIWSAEDEIKESTILMPTPLDIELQIEALKGFNTLERLYKIKNPTLLLAASNDKICTKNAIEEMHKRIPKSIFRVIEKAGHESPKTRASEVNQLLINFLKD
ncbi:MAG: alpha/beta hydrolase [Candidatus Lokiarchaeota archaeon]|nr:alpha/beta hydrolase [Candidatus Lokiarchaeota archaeon]